MRPSSWAWRDASEGEELRREREEGRIRGAERSSSRSGEAGSLGLVSVSVAWKEVVGSKEVLQLGDGVMAMGLERRVSGYSSSNR